MPASGSAKLLILYEATSALDPQSRENVRQTLESLRGSLTILAISQQPGLNDASGRVYVLADGEVTRVERKPAGIGLLRETTHLGGR